MRMCGHIEVPHTGAEDQPDLRRGCGRRRHAPRTDPALSPGDRTDPAGSPRRASVSGSKEGGLGLTLRRFPFAGVAARCRVPRPQTGGRGRRTMGPTGSPLSPPRKPPPARAALSNLPGRFIRASHWSTPGSLIGCFLSNQVPAPPAVRLRTSRNRWLAGSSLRGWTGYADRPAGIRTELRSGVWGEMGGTARLSRPWDWVHHQLQQRVIKPVFKSAFFHGHRLSQPLSGVFFPPLHHPQNEFREQPR